MELRWLEAFVAVAEEMHFGRAAVRLHMAQSPLSQVIRRLERELDAPLFERSTRSVALTASGRALLPHAYRVLKEVRLAADVATSARGVLVGELSLGFSGMHNHHTLPLVARAMRRDHPHVALNLVGGVRTFDGMRMVRNGELDLVFAGLEGELDPLLDAWVLSRQRLGVIVPSEHRLAGRAAVAIGELRSEPFVMSPLDGNSSLSTLVLRVCLRAGFSPTAAQVVGDPFLSLSLVAAGIGIAMTTSEVIPVLPPGVEWVELEGEAVEFLHALVWAREHESPLLDAALGVIRETFPGGVLDPADPAPGPHPARAPAVPSATPVRSETNA